MTRLYASNRQLIKAGWRAVRDTLKNLYLNKLSLQKIELHYHDEFHP